MEKTNEIEVGEAREHSTLGTCKVVVVEEDSVVYCPTNSRQRGYQGNQRMYKATWLSMPKAPTP